MTREPLLLLLLALVASGARAHAQEPFTANHVITFVKPTGQERQSLSAFPAVRDLVAGEFVIARDDLNDDGSKEIILMAATSARCGSGGCEVVVLENRAGRATAILEQNLSGDLAVTTEKIGQYRALAAVDAKGVILSGDQRGTPMFGKQLVYPMSVGASVGV